MKYIYECINSNIHRTEEATRQKFIFIQKTIQQDQRKSCAYCAKDFKNESDLLEHNRIDPNVCEKCNVCFTKTLFDNFHFGHDFIYKDKNK